MYSLFTHATSPAENVTRWERTVQDGEDELDVNRQAEAKQRQDIDRELRRADALKAERAAARARQDRADDACAAARRDLAALQRDAHALQKQLAAAEARLESRRSERRNALRQCRIDDVAVPLLEGGPDAAAEGGAVRVDYRALGDALTDLDDPDDVKRKADKLQKAINALQNTVDKIQAPNMRVPTYFIRLTYCFRIVNYLKLNTQINFYFR